MTRPNTVFKISKLRTGTSKKGQPYWSSNYIDMKNINGKYQVQGFFRIFVWGQQIANEGDKVYIHEITSVSAEKYRNKQGSFSTSYTIGAKCGLEPLKEVENANDNIAQDNVEQ